MIPLEALVYSFLFGLLHGILPDEHTWPITFSYAIGSASGKEGMKAGLYFSAAFTVQRMLVSELAYLALAPFLLSPEINGIVYIVVGTVMSFAGVIVLRKNRYPHLHLRADWHEMPTGEQSIPKDPAERMGAPVAPPPRWAVVHGFIAGFGFGGFSLFINAVAAPAMPSPWLGFMPGLLFGLGTMIMLGAIGGLFGAFLRWVRSLTPEEIKRIGAQTGGRTLFFGGLLFSAAGVATLLGLERYLPVDTGYLLIGLFMLIVAVPAFVHSWKEVLAARKEMDPKWRR
jgi:sulfite exporter TauE/SafE